MASLRPNSSLFAFLIITFFLLSLQQMAMVACGGGQRKMVIKLPNRVLMMNTRYGGGGGGGQSTTPTFYNPYDATFQYNGMNTNNAMYDSQVDETMNYGGSQGDETMNYGGGGGGYERTLDSPSNSVYGRKFPSFEAPPSSDQIYAQSFPSFDQSSLSSLSHNNFNENYYPFHGRASPLSGEKKPPSDGDGDDDSFSRSPFNKRAPMLRGEPSFASFPLKSDHHHDLTYGQVQVP